MDIGEDISLCGSLRIGSTLEVLKRGLEKLVIDSNNRSRRREVGIGGREELSMVETYIQVENAFRLNLR